MIPLAVIWMLTFGYGGTDTQIAWTERAQCEAMRKAFIKDPRALVWSECVRIERPRMDWRITR